MIKETHSKRKSTTFALGFTLVESLVAIAILLVAVTGPMSIASQGLAATRLSREQILATYLAQEAVEFIRNVRDENSIAGNGWQDGLTECISNTPCEVDVLNNTIISPSCSGGTCRTLKYEDATGFYGYNTTSGWEDTKFTRAVTITSISATEMTVFSTISWPVGPRTKSITVEDILLDWQ